MSDSAPRPDSADADSASTLPEVIQEEHAEGAAPDDSVGVDEDQADATEAYDQGSDDDVESDDSDESDDDESDDDDSGDGDGDESDDKQGRSAKLAALDEEGDIAADYLEELLDIADLDGDIDTYTEGSRAHVSIVTDATILVGKDGEVLEALQDLCRLAVMTETGKRSRLMLDIAGHREKRRRELTDLATDAIEEAKASGEPVRLSPMNPFERKIVHDVVAAAGLKSESDGEEPNRRVVVLPGS